MKTSVTFVKKLPRTIPMIYSGVIPFLRDSSEFAYYKRENACLAVWDTGATTTSVSERLVEKMQLTPYGKGIDTRTANGVVETPTTYKLSLNLEGGIIIDDLIVTKMPLQDHLEVVIGLDVICNGDFSLTCEGDDVILKFSYPAKTDIESELESNIE